MSQYEEINASKAFNSGTPVTRRAINGHPMDQDLQRRTRQTDQSRTPTTVTMTPSIFQINPSEGTPKRKTIQYFLPKGNTIKLHTNKNAWVPSFLRVKGTDNCQPLSDEDLQIEDTRKKLLSILNKVSPENIVLLTKTIMSLPIETEKCMNKVIELLFQKAIDEPSYTPQYAHICSAMQMKEVKQNDKRSATSFKNVLIKCCQDRLCHMGVHEDILSKNLQALADCQDQAIKDQLQSKYDQDEMIYRKRSVGNCRYMCELYKVGILTNKTLETSMNYLLKSPSEETLECACNILKHTGKTLSHVKGIFKKLNEFTSAAYKTKIPTRIRFMIQDTIELKENNWVPRNSRPKQESCNIRTPSNAEKPVNKQLKPVHYIPPALTTLSMVVLQNNELTNVSETSGLKQSLLPLNSNDVVKNNKSLVSSCEGREIESTNNYYSSEAENIKINEIEKKYQFILDNITPENIVPMAKSMLLLPIKTNDCLKKLVELLFEKAMDKPQLTPQYAHICSLMKDKAVHSKDHKPSTSFKIILIKTCQNAFEAMFNRKRIVAKDRNEIESCKDKEIRKLLQSKFDQKELNHRSRSSANCRFICELLKVNILVPPVLEMCAARLVQSSKEISMECVCVILEHAGNAFDNSGVIEKLHENSITYKQKLSSRMQSMILDTLELNNSDLMRRKSCEKPQSLDKTDENNFKKSPITDIKEPLADVPSVSKIRNSKQPEIEIQIEPVQNISSPEQKELNVYKTIKKAINSLTAENMNFTINELSALITNIDVMEKTVDFIFARANVRPESIPELVSICSSLRNVVANPSGKYAKPISLKKQILFRCNQILQSGVQNNLGGNGLTHKEPFTFVGELFNANVLSAHTLLEFLQIIPDKLTNRALDNTCRLLKASGKKLEQVYNLKKLFRKFTNMISNDMEGIYSQRSSVLLKELVDLQLANYPFFRQSIYVCVSQVEATHLLYGIIMKHMPKVGKVQAAYPYLLSYATYKSSMDIQRQQVLYLM